jgi:hypothetical protein
MSVTTTTLTELLRHHLGIFIVLVALLGTAACGGDTTARASHPPAAAIAPVPRVTPAVAQSTTPTSSPPTTAATSSTDARPTATLDELVRVAGVRVHVRCSGSGTATVLLVAGYETGSVAWAAVEPTIAEQTRVCTYDRPGTGTSDPATEIATFSTQARDLQDLLTAIGEPGPYVVVGHSFGGAQAVAFASTFPDEVTGLVLVDASPITWPDALCGVTDDGSEAATMLRNLCAGWSEPTGNAEHLDVFAAFADAAAITSLDSLPMAVITAYREYSLTGK